MKLDKKVAVVTGTSSGIGRSIATVFAREGASVVCCSRQAATGEPVADAIRQAGGEACFIPCDVSAEAEVQALVRQTVQRYGRIDILVNNAGVNFVKPFLEVTPADWDRVMLTDLRGTYLCSWHVLPHMLRQGGGAIVNISSVHSVAGLPGAAPYDAAKWGIIGLTKSLAVEFASRNIRVNALSPGLIGTKIWEDIQKAAPDLNACQEYWQANIPMGRVGSTEEIANIAVFLASDAASYITGANLLADGGMTSQLISQAPYQSDNLEGKQR